MTSISKGGMKRATYLICVIKGYESAGMNEPGCRSSGAMRRENN